uniref:IRS-type PTB domain-containing protein n=1 Tax=Accipiter nisus TaxID=211598 RepID=A0A8B9NG06_9AVES
TFSFEAGRRCASGEGNFEFETRQGNEIFQAIESAINRHRCRGAEEPRRGGPADDASRPLGHAKMPSWNRRQDAPAKETVPDPFYDSIGEVGGQVGKQPPRLPAVAKPDHIYDEPEGLSTHIVYDEPEEVKGEAWRLQAAPEEPTGHKYPFYNPQQDDYAVPKRPPPSARTDPHILPCSSPAQTRGTSALQAAGPSRASLGMPVPHIPRDAQPTP